MIRKFPSIALLLVLNCFAASMFGQAPRQATTFPEFQKELALWLAQPENSAQKGWKSLKRWEDQEARHMNPNGSTCDPREYARTLQAIAEEKAAASANKTAGGGWTPFGPNDYATPVMSYDWIPGIGRINCVAFHPTNPNTLWVGVAQGGVWKSVDGGSSWIPLTDDLPMLRISDIAVDPINPDIMYISVGDMAYLGAGLSLDDRKRHTHYGLGVYKTIDGGATWQPTGLSLLQTDFDFSLTCRTVIDPSNTNNLVAAGTHGIWKSSNAGNTWTHTDTSFIWDLKQDPINPNILYAASGYRSSLNYGSAGILKSTDFGSTWTLLTTGIAPQGAVQRIELAISPSNPAYVYALCADMSAGFGGLYRSTNSGTTWELRSSTPNILEWGDGTGGGGQGWYDLALIVDASNPERIYTGGINVWASWDGGTSWDGAGFWLSSYGPSVHADQHQLAYNPLNSKYYLCNDGGLYTTSDIIPGSWDDAQTLPSYQWPTQWTPLSSGMQVTSFYRIDTRDTYPGHLIAGAQDNATYYFDGNVWTNVVGGDGMDCFLHPTYPGILYGSSQYAGLQVSVDGGASFNWIASMPETGEWVTPWQLDPGNPDVVYAALGNVWKSNDLGANWSPISNFPVNANTGQPNVSSAMAVSPAYSDHIYVSKRFFLGIGEVSTFWNTTDGGTTWNSHSLGVPDSLYHTMIAADATDPLTAYVTLGGFLPGVKVMKTTDGGNTWTNYSANLPNLPANCIVQDFTPGNKTLYVGMDVGVYYRNDTMANWALYATDLPNVIVSDLDIHASTGKIYAATFGRGIWGADLAQGIGAGTKDPFAEMSLELYPNPSLGTFELRLTGAPRGTLQVEVVDVMGRTVESRQLDCQAGFGLLRFEEKRIPGAYFVRINANGRSISRKIMVAG
jgi:photosystem II stability/assembly factor-like uncharacterized protein